MKKKNIEYEFDQIYSEIKIIRILKKVIDKQELDEIQLRAAASCLHSIYNGIEKILSIKLKQKQIMLENTNRWHIDILDRALSEKLIEEKLYKELREYLGFRHFFRHNYGFLIDNELLKPLIIKIEKVIKELRKEI